eukprot:7253194-Pyramimonas_sp.AAC.1
MPKRYVTRGVLDDGPQPWLAGGQLRETAQQPCSVEGRGRHAERERERQREREKEAIHRLRYHARVESTLGQDPANIISSAGT